MWRGAWKSHPCLLLHMKVSITTQGYHHNQQQHSLSGNSAKIASSLPCSNCYLFNGWLDLLLYIFCMVQAWDNIGAVFFSFFFWGFGRLAFQAFLTIWQPALKPSAGPKEIVELGFKLYCFIFHGNECLKGVGLFELNEMSLLKVLLLVVWFVLFMS